MYAEAVDDDKLRLLAFEDRWHFVALLCLKAGGVLDSDPQTLERRIAVKLGLMPPDLAEVKRRLREIGLIEDNWQPLSWGKRQFESDHTGAERSRRWRRKTKRSGDVSVTSRKRRSDGPEQNRTDTEQKEGADAPGVVGLDAKAWERFVAYRVEIRKPLKEASMLEAKKKLAGFAADQMAVVEQTIAQGWQGLFDLKSKPPKNGSANEWR
jgi:hypothetical protein